MEQVNAFFTTVAVALGGQIMTVLALTAAQVVLAVAVALKNKVFEWRALADFFGTIVVPKLLGWLATAIIARFVLAAYIPPGFGAGIADTAFLAVIASLTGAVLSNLQSLEILPAQVSKLLDSVGVPAKPPAEQLK